MSKMRGELIVKAVPLFRNVASDIKVSGAKKFVSAEKFTKENKAVKFAYFSQNFKRVMLEKVEENVSDAMFTCCILTETSPDAPILVELGNRAETTLAYLYELLTKQPNGEDGVLLTNGCANIFYIRGADDVLWAVSAYWRSGGWYVYANSVEDPDGWFVGNVIFSR